MASLFSFTMVSGALFAGPLPLPVPLLLLLPLLVLICVGCCSWCC